MHTLSSPTGLLRLRQVLLAVFALWAVLALSGLLWALLPTRETPVDASLSVINPVQQRSAVRVARRLIFSA